MRSLAFCRYWAGLFLISISGAAFSQAASIGAVAGAISGAIAGATMAGIANLDCETHCQDLTGIHLLGGAIGGLMGAAVGVTLGAAVGATLPAWQQVYAKN